MNDDALHGVYGVPPIGLVAVARGARQLSPLVPGADDLGAALPGSYSSIAMVAPPGTVERRCAIALALRALKPGGDFVIMAPNDKGGTRLRKELEACGCEVEQTSKAHHRICTGVRGDALIDIEEAIAAGALQPIEGTAFWSQPGVFSWDRLDPGSAMLAAHVPLLKGRGADLGCGIGLLALQVLVSRDVTRLDLVDIDARAIAAARRNVGDERAHFHWADVAAGGLALAGLDFVVMNPPFHHAGTEDKSLGAAFVRRAAQLLRPGGVCWLVANRHLPYEAALAPLFKTVRLHHEGEGYKVYEAVK